MVFANGWRCLFLLLGGVLCIPRAFSYPFQIYRFANTENMRCSYGERGSLTAICQNATPTFFKTTPYRFDHLDETLRCLNCTLRTIDSGTFDISGNQLKNIELAYSQIEKLNQKAFLGLIFLEKMSLAHNQIRSIYPGTFQGVKKIVSINLESNSLDILSDDGFKELVALETLNLKQNQIKNTAKRAFNGLNSLKSLDLSYNNLEEIEEVLVNLTSLQTLKLNNNKIAKLTSRDFNNLTSLLELDLSHNQIKTLPALEFFNVTSLRHLDLSSNVIEVIVADAFRDLLTLEVLNLAHNSLIDIPPRTVQNLKSIHTLNLSHNRLVTFETGRFSGLPQLNTLDLSHNSIDAIKIVGVLPLHSLHTLDLSANNITDLDYEALVWRLPRISFLNLVDNLLPCDLDKEMEHYFRDDNFKFILYNETKGAVQCVDRPRQAKASDKVYSDKIQRENFHNSSATIWLYVLVCFLIVSVALLYFIQLRSYREIRAINLQRTVSKMQLISSQLEPTEND